MEENEYKQAYHGLNPLPCVFEKAVLSHRCGCEKSRRLYIAEREGIACTCGESRKHCLDFLETLFQNARFALHLSHPEAPLPHAKNMKLQCGGLRGLQAVVDGSGKTGKRDALTGVVNIHRTLMRAWRIYVHVDDFPYQDIVKYISEYQVRPKR